MMKIKYLLLLYFLGNSIALMAQKTVPLKPRILVSTDIGGTDPDDNQSMAHLLMYNDCFIIEGLISSPSFGEGSKQEILKMIGLYEKDYVKLKKHRQDFLSPDTLRRLCKQGRKGSAPFKGYDKSTEGSEWIVECARKQSDRPLWVLVWGGLDDLAQALHDAPDIQNRIKVYWIGGPNKKWSVNSYAYIVENFPNLWVIEANATYRGFIADDKKTDKFNKYYYDFCIKESGSLGEDYKNYYGGSLKMGDTPSLLYIMDGDPNNPSKESWGGSFEPLHFSPRTIFTRNTTLQDTIPVYSIIEFRFQGPKTDKPVGTSCFVMTIDRQKWSGVYLGKGTYAVRYAPKAPAVLNYTITSEIPELNGQKGVFVVSKLWPDKAIANNYKLGKRWFTDKKDLNLFEGQWQGAKTVSKWRNDVLLDWEKRLNWLKSREVGISEKPRVNVTSDGEIDDECSMVRFLLYTNEWDVESIITSSSQYHWRGHKWAGDDWLNPCLKAYAEVYPNLVKHDSNYPTPEYLRSHTFLGNVDAEGEMDIVTEGSRQIVKVLLDETDNRPVWIQAWGGTNTLARALKTIEEEHPEKMSYVANKMRFFFIWEQDSTYQSYIRPHWGRYNIKTIISDQFEAIAYRWKMVQPVEMQKYYEGVWMKENILNNHGALCSYYKAHENGDFRSEGDSPAFLHTINVGLRNLENPDWGGWGGRYVKVRENTWLDPVPVSDYLYPEGRWYGENGWGRSSLRPGSTVTIEKRSEYFKPMWRWSAAMQNDFAARADWCMKSYEEANHPPVVVLAHAADLEAMAGETLNLSVKGTNDPDGDNLTFYWWQYTEADSYLKSVEIRDADKQNATIVIPYEVKKGDSIHLICEVTDDGTPNLTRYQRVVIQIK